MRRKLIRGWRRAKKKFRHALEVFPCIKRKHRKRLMRQMAFWCLNDKEFLCELENPLVLVKELPFGGLKQEELVFELNSSAILIKELPFGKLDHKEWRDEFCFERGPSALKEMAFHTIKDQELRGQFRSSPFVLIRELPFGKVTDLRCVIAPENKQLKINSPKEKANFTQSRRKVQPAPCQTTREGEFTSIYYLTLTKLLKVTLEIMKLSQPALSSPVIIRVPARRGL